MIIRKRHYFLNNSTCQNLILRIFIHSYNQKTHSGSLQNQSGFTKHNLNLLLFSSGQIPHSFGNSSQKSLFYGEKPNNSRRIPEHELYGILHLIDVFIRFIDNLIIFGMLTPKKNMVWQLITMAY